MTGPQNSSRLTRTTCGSARTLAITSSDTGSSTATMQMASPPGLSRPRLKVAMLTPGLAHQHAEAADEARLVGVADEQHVRGQLELHVDVAHLDDARAAVGEHRAGDRAVVLVGLHGQADVALEGAVLAARHLLQPHAALLAR